MAKKATRKLFLFGRYSLALLLPKKWLTELGVEIGDSVNLEYHTNKKRVVVIFSADISKPKATLSKAPPKNDPKSGWEPIPNIE